MKHLKNIKDLKEKRGIMRILILISCVLTFIILSSLISAQSADEFKPYLHKASVGNVPKLETFGEYKTQLFPGAGSFEYPIEVSPGVLGFQPLISLDYNSQSVLQRPGIVGAGWSLTENYVMRDVNHTVNYTNDDYFVLVLGNSRYKLFYNGTNFNTKIDPRKFKIQNLSSGTKMFWNVTTSDGTFYRFGFNGNSLLESNGSNYDIKWGLDLIQDVHGNKIFYGYKKVPFTSDTGTLYLYNITYNNDNLKLITFNYEGNERPDSRLIYEQGNPLRESRRLQDISVYFNGSLIRRYHLDYENLSAEKSLTSLSNITYIGSDNSSVLNTISFGYYQTIQGFDNTTDKWVVPESFSFSSTSAVGIDSGVRLLDVNNDGFVDLVKSKAGTNETKINNKLTGWDSYTLFKVPVDFVDSNNVDQGVRFGDVNTDGLIDILKSKDSTRIVYLNNGTGWYISSNWNIPIDFTDSSGNDLGSEIIDVNGDGKVDILRSHESSAKLVYLNNGTGWQNFSNFVVPDYFITSSNQDNGLRLIDLNNDGLPDLIKGGIPGNAWLNNGTGWISYSDYAPSLSFTDYSGSRPDLGVRFMDINGDGLTDILQNFYSNVTTFNETCNCNNSIISFETNTKINNGTGWVAGAGWLSPERFTDEGYNIGRRIADVNGDGYADIVRAYSASPYQGVTNIKNGTSAFLLKTITHTYGGTTQVNYKQSTLNDNDDNLGFNIWIVNSTFLNNSVSQGFNAGSVYLYNYSNGRFDYSNLEFLGFGLVNETLPDGSVNSHYFHQDNILKGREHKTIVYNSINQKIREEQNYFTYSFDNMIHLNQTSSLVYDGSSTPVISNISFSYDNFGNVKLINYSGQVNIQGDEKLEEFDFNYNSQRYVVNKPVNYTLFASDGQTIVKREFFFYDGLSSGVDKGDLTKITSYNNKGTNPETQFVYDSFGNIISKIEPLGSNTDYTYDGLGTFVQVETNDLGHTIGYNYNQGTGNLLNEFRHGLNKTFEYDIFGRIINETISPDNKTNPTKKYTYNFDGATPEIIKVESKNKNSDYSEDLFIYDGFGNVIQVKTLYDTGVQIVKNYFYDNKYRIKQEQNPYFETYSANLVSPQSESIISYTYDSQDRIINFSKQDNSSIFVLFNQTNITQFDENGNKILYIIDAYNRIKEIKEYNDSTIYNTTYFYRADDKLINITDTKNNKFYFEYDTLGQRISFDDPNMQTWNYSYDLNGNLKNQTDGRNITTNLTYDSLNRLIFKQSGNSNVSFVYDGQFNGTLTNITDDGELSGPIYIRYTYDNRLRIINESIFSCYRIVGDPGGSNDECEVVNYSVDYDSQDRILNMYLPHETFTHNYNKIGKLNSINNYLSTINYTAFGKISNKTYSNTLVTKIDYDELNRLTRIQTQAMQNLSYQYDSVGNIINIYDANNSLNYTMQYDDLNRLVFTKIYNGVSQEVSRYSYIYDGVGNLLQLLTDTKNITLSYNSLAHTPSSYETIERLSPQITITTHEPTSSITVNQSDFFNYTTEVCCLNNDCGLVDVYLDPIEIEKTQISETFCDESLCNSVIYSGTRFVYEDEKWKNIENARSLKNVWYVIINEDPTFPAKVVDYNYSSITLDLSFDSNIIRQLFGVPLRVYEKGDETQKPTDNDRKVIDKDRRLRSNQVVTIDFSDTKNSILSQEIKWGDASTIITIHDNNSVNMGDTYLDEDNNNANFGTSSVMEIHNSSSNQDNILIQFNTSQIPREAVIINARLNLFLDGNDLDTGDSFTVSSYHLFHTYNFGETSVTWNSRPSSSDFDSTPTDSVTIEGGTGSPGNQYIDWNVTSILQNKDLNESFYLVPTSRTGSISITEELQFSTKENFAVSEHPYLNITYQLKGIISTTIGETPFYTNTSNPKQFELNQNNCVNVSWDVNATGDAGDYVFFAFANKTTDNSIYNESETVIITIESPIIPNDTHKFRITNSTGNNVAWLGSEGNIVLKGSCTSGGTCTAPANSFIIKDSSGDTKAFIDSDGNLCIESATTCANSDQQVSCSSPNDSFIVKDGSNNEVIVIDSTNGNQCLTGTLYENSTP